MPSTAPTQVSAQDYSAKEERLNVLTHLAGLLIALPGLWFLIQKANGTAQVASVVVYGVSLILVFLASSCYHAVLQPGIRAKLKLMDHAAIYLLIAGTYTPLLTISLSGTVSVVSMIIIWSMAIAGITFKLVAGTRFPKIAIATYLGMGWFAVFLVWPLMQNVPAAGLWLILAGGLLFSLGVPFYQAKSKQYTHALWHLFVVGGCSCHYAAVYGWVL